MGATTNAAQAVVPIWYSSAPAEFTLAAFMLPPGAVVVSTSTTVEFTSCTGDVGRGVGEAERVPLPVGVVDGVPLKEGVIDGVPDNVAVLDRVPDGVELDVKVGEGVDVAVPPADAVLLLVGVGLGLGSTTPCRYTPAP